MSQRIKLGFIGAGWWATSNHIPILQNRQDVEFSAVCRKGTQELEKVAKHFGFEYSTENYLEMLEQCDLNGVIISSPHSLHYEHAKAALNRGMHVMCEKPMTLNAKEANELVDIANKQGLHLLVPYGWHYKNFVKEAKKKLSEKCVGEIYYVLVHMASPALDLLTGKSPIIGTDGKTVENQAVNTANAQMFFEPGIDTWANLEVAGGGYGHSQITHSMGMFFWLTKMRIKKVFAKMSGPNSQVELYNAMTTLFDNGAIGVISGSGSVPSTQNFQLDIRIFGSEGQLSLDCDRARMDIQRHDNNNFSLDLKGDEGAYDCEGPPNNFVDLIKGNTTENNAPGWAAARSVEFLDLAYRSIISSKEESIESLNI